MLEAELNECKGKLENCESQIKNLKIKEDSLKNELSRRSQDFETHKVKNNFKMLIVVLLNNDIMQKKTMIFEMKNHECEKTIEKLENDIKSLESNVEKEELEEKLSKANNEILNLQQKFDSELENLVVQVKNKEVNEIAEKYEKKINDLTNQIATFNNSMKYISELEKSKQTLEIEVIDLRKQLANTSGIAISEDIEILEDDLQKEYEKKIIVHEAATEKKLNEKFSNDYEEKMKALKEGYDHEISRVQEEVKNLEEEIENRAKLKISSEYEKKLLEIKNKYELEISCLKENVRETESNNEKNNEIMVKNLKKSFKNEKKNLEEKIDKLSDEKNLLLQEKNAWEDILKKNSKIFEKIPSFFASSIFFIKIKIFFKFFVLGFFMKSDINDPSKENKNQIISYLFLLNKGKQNQGFKIENNSLILNKAKKEKFFKFKEIFINEDLIIEQFSKLVELKTSNNNNKCLIVLFGPKKTKKKYFFIEVIEQLIINFLDAIRSKNFNRENDNTNESNLLNYELKVSFEQYPPDSNVKELNFTLNSQFYVSQMISHHQKLTASIENSFNKFKTAFMKRSYINKNEVN